MGSRRGVEVEKDTERGCERSDRERDQIEGNSKHQCINNLTLKVVARSLCRGEVHHSGKEEIGEVLKSCRAEGHLNHTLSYFGFPIGLYKGRNLTLRLKFLCIEYLVLQGGDFESSHGLRIIEGRIYCVNNCDEKI